MPSGFPPGLSLTPVDWREGPEGPPGNEDSYLPRGFLLGAPNVIFPYRDMASDRYYGSEPSTVNPLKDAPLQDPCGGTVYFETTKPDHLKALSRSMGLMVNSKSYVAFGFSSRDPVSDRYLDQIKIITHAALSTLFQVKGNDLPENQSLTIENLVVEFVVAQRQKWNEEGRTFSSKLSGTAGGDGDWAKEGLAFGLHVENPYWGSYRIWSRPWLVTK